MKKQVIAISLAAMTALSLMACSGQKSEGTASSDACYIQSFDRIYDR